MQITRVDIIPVTIPYPEPYVVASSAKPAQGDVLVKIYTDEGIIGLGEAVSRPLRGCTQSVLTTVLVRELAPAILGQNPLHREWLIETRLGGMDNPWLPALHAIDIALWDIAGKYYQRPLYDLLGGAVRRTITLSRSLPVKPPGETAERAVALKEQGYKLLTVKIGFDPEEDLKRVEAVCRAVGSYPPVEVDVNEGYTLDIAIPYIKRMEPFISGCEQPLPAWDYLGMAELARVLTVPIIADQSVRTARDAALLACLRAADVICVKLAEVGGITLARKLVAVAQAYGLPCTMGSAHPLGIGTAAIHHFAAATSWIRLPIGYGSPLERLPDDILANPIRVTKGEVHLWDGPGLGIELDEEKVKFYSTSIKVEHEKPVLVPVDKSQPWRTGV